VTVSSTAVSKSYKPGSAMAPEAIGFQFLDASDIEVVHVAAATGVRTTLVPGTNYVIAGDTMAGTATVTATAAWPAGDDFVLTRRTAMLQSTVLIPQEPLKAKAIERQLDRLALVDQEHDSRLGAVEDTAIFAAPGEDGFALPAKAARAGKVAAFTPIGAGAALAAIELTASQLEGLAGQDVAIGVLALNIGALLAVNGDLANINLVAGDIGMVHAVGFAIGNVNIVAGSIANVNAVAGNAVNINIVAASAGNVNAVAGGMANVNAVAGGIADVATVATDLNLGAASKIKAVANSLAQIVAVATDLLLGAASKIAIVAADLALGAASLIGKAPQAATDAATALAAATALVAGIPAGAGTIIVGTGLPASNLGAVGASYYDQASGLTYGPKSVAAWPLGPIGDVNAGWNHQDLSLGAPYPTGLLPWTRANPATAILTNLCYWDAPGAAYQTFGPNVPIQRIVEGTLVNATSRNVFLNSTAPVTQNCTVVAGTIIVWSNNDPGVTITTAAGTAVGAGFGPVVPGAPQVLTITTGGTISVTRSGAGTWYACQVEYNPILPNNSVATPLIITAGAAITRDADSNSGAGALLAAFQAASGSFIMEVSRVETQTGYGRTPGLLSVNNAVYSLVSNNTTFAHNGALVTSGLANQTWSTPQKWGFCWGAGAQTYGAGDGMPVAYATAFPFGTVATVRMGAKDATTAGQQALCGWIKRIKWRSANDRIADRALYDQYSATAIPTVANSGSKLIRTSLPGNALPNTKTGVAAVKANTRDSIHIFLGTSHTAGVQPGSAPSINSMPAKYAARLSAQYGIPTRYAGWFGNNNSAPSAGASIYRPERLSYSAGFTAYGVQMGGASAKTSTNGAVITDVVPGISDTYSFYYWTFPGYGSWTLADGNGHSKTVPATTAFTASAAAGVMTVSAMPAGAYLAIGDVLTGGTMPAGTTVTGFGTGTGGNGTYTISSTTTVVAATINAIGPRVVTLAPADGMVRGANTMTMTSIDANPKTAIGGLERDSLVKSVLVINGGTSLRTAVTLATDAMNSGAAENSVQAIVRLLKPDFLHFEGVTNDASTGTPESVYSASVQYCIAQGLISGDVVVSGDPPTAPGTIPQATQDRYTWLEYRAAYSYGVPIIALPDVLGPRLKWANIGLYSSDPTHGTGNTVISFNGDIWGNMVADFVGANV
jgi:hypothetical protein